MQSEFLVLALCKTVISDHDDALNMIACNKKTLMSFWMPCALSRLR